MHPRATLCYRSKLNSWNSTILSVKDSVSFGWGKAFKYDSHVSLIFFQTATEDELRTEIWDVWASQPNQKPLFFQHWHLFKNYVSWPNTCSRIMILGCKKGFASFRSLCLKATSWPQLGFTSIVSLMKASGCSEKNTGSTGFRLHSFNLAHIFFMF